jgi:hypothetical protein
MRAPLLFSFGRMPDLHPGHTLGQGLAIFGLECYLSLLPRLNSGNFVVVVVVVVVFEEFCVIRKTCAVVACVAVNKVMMRRRKKENGNRFGPGLCVYGQAS